MERKERYFYSGESEDGPDTVRILPDDTPSVDDEWRVEKHPVQSGSLYTPSTTPSSPSKPPSPAAKEPTPNESFALQPYDSRPLQSTSRNAERAPESAITQPAPVVTHINKGPSACSIIAATVGVLLVSCALLAF